MKTIVLKSLNPRIFYKQNKILAHRNSLPCRRPGKSHRIKVENLFQWDFNSVGAFLLVVTPVASLAPYVLRITFYALRFTFHATHFNSRSFLVAVNDPFGPKDFTDKR
jgi:hypothetical protein